MEWYVIALIVIVSLIVLLLALDFIIAYFLTKMMIEPYCAPKKDQLEKEMNLKKIIAESREVAQALNEFADNLERIEEKYAEPQESEE